MCYLRHLWLIPLVISYYSCHFCAGICISIIPSLWYVKHINPKKCLWAILRAALYRWLFIRSSLRGLWVEFLVDLKYKVPDNTTVTEIDILQTCVPEKCRVELRSHSTATVVKRHLSIPPVFSLSSPYFTWDRNKFIPPWTLYGQRPFLKICSYDIPCAAPGTYFTMCFMALQHWFWAQYHCGETAHGICGYQEINDQNYKDPCSREIPCWTESTWHSHHGEAALFHSACFFFEQSMFHVESKWIYPSLDFIQPAALLKDLFLRYSLCRITGRSIHPALRGPPALVLGPISFENFAPRIYRYQEMDYQNSKDPCSQEIPGWIQITQYSHCGEACPFRLFFLWAVNILCGNKMDTSLLGLYIADDPS